MVDIIGLDQSPHGGVISRADDNSGVGQVVNMVVGNNILVAMTGVNPKRAEKDLTAVMNVIVGDDVLPGLLGRLPDPEEGTTTLNFDSYRWQQHCRDLYQTPIAA